MRIFARRGGSMRSRYRDRFEAGAVLAGRLSALAGQPDLLVLALPRGGVPVAFEVARRLGAELDVFVVRKLGVPGQEQLAMGAIASGGTRVLNDSVIEALGIDDETIEVVAAQEQRELERRERLFRGDRPPPGIQGRTVVVSSAHGSGWSRHSPRNRQVARTLQRFGLGTLLIDLLTPEEGEAERYTRHLRFDIDLLADRVVGAARWLSRYPLTQHLPIGCFGASTGAAAALGAAAREPGGVRAAVSRGGPPGLAG